MNGDGRGLRVIRLDATLARDEGGQISVLGVLGAAVFACLLLLVINTGYATSGKIEMQNAADATAISGATWVARGLNVISLNNVTSTQILAIVVIVKALDADAIGLAIKTLEIQEKACALLTVGAAVCVAIIRGQILLLEGLDVAVSALAPLVEKPSGLLWQAMLALEAISTVVAKTFVIMAEVEADRIARQNGADLGFVIPAALKVTIPVRQGSMQPDLCEPTRRGPLAEYSGKLNTGFYLVINSLIQLWFWEAKERHFAALCGGSSGSASPGAEARTLQECRLKGGGTAYWAVVYYELVTDTPQLPSNYEALAGAPQKGTPETIQTSCNWPSPFFNGATYRVFAAPQQTTVAGQTKYLQRVTVYTFLSASLTGDDDPEEPEPLSQGSASADNPDPYMLEDDAEEKLHYLSIVYRQREGAAAPDYFISALGKHRMAYGQARVYNPVAFDTFTQEWRVTLEPASLIENNAVTNAFFGKNFDGIVKNAAAVGGFQQSMPFFQQLRADFNVLKYMNNH